MWKSTKVQLLHPNKKYRYGSVPLLQQQIMYHIRIVSYTSYTLIINISTQRII